MMHSTQSLYDELSKTLVETEAQIRAVKKDLEKQIEAMPYPENVTVYDMKYTNGHWCLTELLAAKTRCLAALTDLKVSQEASRRPPAAGRQRGGW